MRTLAYPKARPRRRSQARLPAQRLLRLARYVPPELGELVVENPLSVLAHGAVFEALVFGVEPDLHSRTRDGLQLAERLVTVAP